MNTSSTARQLQRDFDASTQPTPSPTWDYRQSRTHLFPVDDYRAAAEVGGQIRAYCGVVEIVPRLGPAEVEETTEPLADDCVTCVDVWLDRAWVRL